MTKYHILTHETHQFYTAVEADSEEQAKEIALRKGGTWITVPTPVHHEVVAIYDESIPHKTDERD